MRTRTVFRLALVLAFVLGVLLVQVIKSIRIDQYRPMLVSWARAETGRELTFSGPLSLKLSLRPTLVADGVALAGAPGAGHAELIKLDHVEAHVGLLPLLSGQVRIQRIKVNGATAWLEMDPQGRGNWLFAAGPAGPAGAFDLPMTSLHVTQVLVTGAAIHWHGDEDHLLTVERATIDMDNPGAPAAVTAETTVDGRHWTVNGVLGSVRDALNVARPMTVRLKALSSGWVVSADGAFQRDAAQALQTSLSVALEAADSADLNGWIGLPLPSLGSARAAFTLEGALSHPRLTLTDATLGRHDALAITLRGKIADPRQMSGIDLALTADGDGAAFLGNGGGAAPLPLSFSGHVVANGAGGARGWKLMELKGTAGRSDVTGQASLSIVGEHKSFDAKFESLWVDAARFNDSGAETDFAATDGRVVPDEKLPIALFDGSDGHLQWRIAKANLHNLPMAGLAFDLSWHDRKAQATWNVEAAEGGRADGKLALDGQAQPASLTAELSLSHVLLGDGLRDLGVTDAFEGGRTDLRFKASGAGESWRSAIATLQGSLLLSIGPTRIAERLAQEGLGGVIRMWMPERGMDRAELRCLIQQASLSDGLLRSEALVFALPTVIASGQGSVSLTQEGLDITLTPRPPQPGTAALEVGGTLLHPVVAEDRSAAVRNMPLSLADTTNGLQSLAGNESNGCFTVLTQARKRANPGNVR